MRMAPIFSRDGQLIGHADKDMYPWDHCSLIVDDRPHGFIEYDPTITAETTFNIFRIPLMEILFVCKKVEKKVSYLVIDEKLPPWFWDAYGIVEFKPGDWRS